MTSTAPIGSYGLFESWLNALSAGTQELVAHGAAALTRGSRPLDVVRWWELATTRRPPRWASPHEIVFDTPLARLRDFSPASAADVVPTLVLPPQAGHDSCIVDYSPEQSQMQAIVTAGLERAFALDWVGATAATRDSSVGDYLDVIGQAVDQLGGRVNLIGDCQGGWLATIYAALNPERVNTLTIAGAPIDFHAGEPIIHELLRYLAPGGRMAFYEGLVRAGGGVLRGEHMLSGFVAISPADEIARQLELLRLLDDDAHVARYVAFENWFKHTQDIPGAFYLWIIRHLFRDNALIGGSLTIGGRRVDLAEITMPLNLLAGSEDHITPPAQVYALARHARTPAADVTRELATGGHLGLFMGHDALQHHWPPILAAVRAHS